MENLKGILVELKDFAEVNHLEIVRNNSGISVIKELPKVLQNFVNVDILNTIKLEMVSSENVVDVLIEKFHSIEREKKKTYGGLIGELLYNTFKEFTEEEGLIFWSWLEQITREHTPFIVDLSYSENLAKLVSNLKKLKEKEFRKNKTNMRKLVGKIRVPLNWENVFNANRSKKPHEICEANEIAAQYGYAYFVFKDKLYVSGNEPEETDILVSEIK